MIHTLFTRTYEKALCKAAKNVYYWWAEGADHNNIDVSLNYCIITLFVSKFTAMNILRI